MSPPPPLPPLHPPLHSSPSPRPASPILASALLALETKRRRKFAASGKGCRIGTGASVIDEFLLGGGSRTKDEDGEGEDEGEGNGDGELGFERGTVVGLSAVEGAEARLISLHLLASVLVSNTSFAPTQEPLPLPPPSTPKATIIDTTGTFPLALLAQVLASRFRDASQRQSSKLDPSARRARHVSGRQDKRRENARLEHEEEFVSRLVQNALERVTISRVFDVEGLWEVLGEMGRGVTSEGVRGGGSGRELELGDEMSDLIAPGDALNAEASVAVREANAGPAKEKEIGDSQEQDDEEMLLGDLDFESVPGQDKGRVQDQEQDGSHDSKGDGDGDDEEEDEVEEEEDDEGVELIIVDNMTHLITELFSRREKSEAHAHLALLTRTIHTLTRHHNTLTILHNTTVSSTFSSHHPTAAPQPQVHVPTANNPFSALQHQAHFEAHTSRHTNTHTSTHAHTTPHPTTPSIFASNPIKPSLGLLFAPIPDLHLLLSRMPKRRADAETLYARGLHVDESGGEAATKREVEFCAVLEVVKDGVLDWRPGCGGWEEQGVRKRTGGREKRWVPLVVSEDGMGLELAFGAEDEEKVWDGVGQSGRADRGKVGNGSAVGREQETGRERGMVPRMYGFGGRRV